jgi:hypothetical protein
MFPVKPSRWQDLPKVKLAYLEGALLPKGAYVSTHLLAGTLFIMVNMNIIRIRLAFSRLYCLFKTQQEDCSLGTAVGHKI